MEIIACLNKDLCRAVDNVREAADEIWAVPKHKYYTDHTVKHSERIIEKLDGLASGVMLSDKRLSQHEIYVLLAATYLHDIGMQNELFADGNLEWIRANHEQVTYEMIIGSIGDGTKFRTLGLIPDPDLVEAVGRVAAGHRRRDLTSHDYAQFEFENETIRPQLLAALLRLGDALDIDHRRVFMENLKLARISAQSCYHWFRCYYISGVRIQNEFVSIGYRLPSGKDYENLIVRLVENGIRTELGNLENILRIHGAKPGLADPSIRFGAVVKEMPQPVLDWAREELKRQARILASVVPVNELVKEVIPWIKAMGFTVSEQRQVDECCIDFTAKKEEGSIFQCVLVRCVDGEISLPYVQSLEVELRKHRVPLGWIVSDKRVAKTAKDHVSNRRYIRVWTPADFEREIFGPYFEYLRGLVEGRDIERYYVDLSCDKPVFDEKVREIARDSYPIIDDYIDGWLNERGTNHISILGEFGSGKTWFCRHYAYRQLRRYLADPSNQRIPLLVTLRHYARFGDISQLITDLLVNRYKVKMTGSYEVFNQLNRSGRLLLIVDGFDEMAIRADPVANFEALAQTVVPGSKVLLTCRTPYFRDCMDECRLLAPGHITAAPNFEILYLKGFSEEQIREVLCRRAPDRWKGYEQTIKDLYDLSDLAERPVMLDMIAAALPELENMKSVNHAMLYQTYTDKLWIEKAIAEDRTLVDAESKRFFAQEVAWEMFRTGILTIHVDRISGLVQRFLEPTLNKKQDLRFLEADVRNASFISKRDECGNYEFVHRSFMEFFAAQKLAQAVRDGNSQPFGEREIYYEIIRFFNQMIEADCDVVPRMIEWWDNPGSSEIVRANCIRISCQWVEAEVLTRLIALARRSDEPSSLRRDAIRSIVRMLHGEEADWASRHVRLTLQAFAIRTSRDKLIVGRLPLDVKLLHRNRMVHKRLRLHDKYVHAVAECLFDCLSVNEPEEIRLNASYALIHFMQDDVVSRVDKLARSDQNSHVRFNCCTALGAVDSPDARVILEDLIDSSSDKELVRLGQANLAAIRKEQSP